MAFLRKIFCLLPGSALIGTSLAEPVDFSRDIRPIINAQCIACHGGVKKSSNVSFLFREEALGTGESGKATVVPGDPDASQLMKYINLPADDKLVMPPKEHGPPLSAEEIDLFRRWIKEGAKWGDHWSFEVPKTSTAPEVKESSWAKGKIDKFVLARLESENIPHSAPATAEEMLRRLNFDIIGLPPTPAELDEFTKSYALDPDKTVATKVDQLLKSEHFGEKWASHWLDLARYADSEGLGVDVQRFMHPYRDWVIRALNQDMPYDQFTIKQLAGDLLPNPSLDDLVATAFHRQTQANGEGGTDDEEFRVIAVMDRVATTWETWQGLTFSCVQCHSHPYEPIRHEEYYTFMSFFNNTRDKDIGSHHPRIRIPNDHKLYPKVGDLYKKTKALNKKHLAKTLDLTAKTKWAPATQMTAKSNRTKVKVGKDKGVAEFRSEGTISRSTVYTLNVPVPQQLDRVTALKLDILPKDLKKAIHTPEWGGVLSQIKIKYTPAGEKKATEYKILALLGDDSNPSFSDSDSLQGKKNQGWGPNSKIFKKRTAIALLDKPIEQAKGGTVTVSLSYNRFILAAFPLVAQRGQIALTDDQRLSDWYRSKEATADRQTLASTRKEIHKIPGISLPVMEELDSHLKRDTLFFEGGNWLEKKGANLLPNVPASLNTFSPKDPANPTRLDLANWFTSPENPLTARVTTNRVWEQLFGYGIVLTLEDFGSSGELPSHPELLDDLAVRFRTDMKWSLKSLIREITNSATYRQSAKGDLEMRTTDSYNKLLSRGPRNRLSAEMVRDHSLSASGLINKKLFGKHSYPPVPSGGYTAAGSRKDWHTNKVGDPARYRRALYTYIKRSSPYPSLMAFDAPSRENCSKRRLVSNTPIAALTSLNDPLFSESCSAMAKRIEKTHPGKVTEQIKLAYRLATSRQIVDHKLSVLQKLYESTLQQYTEKPHLAKQLKVSPATAALITVCSVALNLDEAITK